MLVVTIHPQNSKKKKLQQQHAQYNKGFQYSQWHARLDKTQHNLQYRQINIPW